MILNIVGETESPCVTPLPVLKGCPYYFPDFGTNIKASGMYPFRNATCMILTTLSHVSVSRSLSLVAAHNHALRCSAFILDGPPAQPNWSFLTVAAISPTYGGPFLILTVCTKIEIISPSGGRSM